MPSVPEKLLLAYNEQLNIKKLNDKSNWYNAITNACLPLTLLSSLVAAPIHRTPHSSIHSSDTLQEWTGTSILLHNRCDNWRGVHRTNGAFACLHLLQVGADCACTADNARSRSLKQTVLTSVSRVASADRRSGGRARNKVRTFVHSGCSPRPRIHGKAAPADLTIK